MTPERALLLQAVDEWLIADQDRHAVLAAWKAFQGDWNEPKR